MVLVLEIEAVSSRLGVPVTVVRSVSTARAPPLVTLIAFIYVLPSFCLSNQKSLHLLYTRKPNVLSLIPGVRRRNGIKRVFVNNDSRTD